MHEYAADIQPQQVPSPAVRVGKPFGHEKHKDRRGDTADQCHDLRHIGQTAAKIIDVVYRHDDKRDQLKLEPIQTFSPFHQHHCILHIYFLCTCIIVLYK